MTAQRREAKCQQDPGWLEECGGWPWCSGEGGGTQKQREEWLSRLC